MRDRLRCALILREMHETPPEPAAAVDTRLPQGEVAIGRPQPRPFRADGASPRQAWAGPQEAVRFQAAAARVSPAPASPDAAAVAPAPLVIEPVLPPSAAAPPPPVVATPAARKTVVAVEAPAAAARFWPIVLVSAAIIAVTIWLLIMEWRWLSLPYDRRADVARGVVDRWEGPGAYSRIDQDNNRLFRGSSS